jgi:hypothetical protein
MSLIQSDKIFSAIIASIALAAILRAASVTVRRTPSISDRHDQRVSRLTVKTFEIGLFLPPTTDRKHTNRVALGEIGGAAEPEVRMR